MPVHGVTNAANSDSLRPPKNKAPAKKKSTTKTPAVTKKAQASKKKTPPSLTSTRNKNFTIEEDVFLCKAFMCTSHDPIKGVGQRKETLWANCKERYDELVRQEGKPGLTNRTPEALCNRWKNNIQKKVGKFLPYIRRIVKQNPSGANMDDMMKLATEAHLEEMGYPFTLHACVDVLQVDPFFNVKKKPPASEEEIVIEGDDDDEEDGNKKPAAINDIGSIMGSGLTRPIGAKAAKTLLKQQSSQSFLTEANSEVKEVTSRQDKIIANQQKAIANQEKAAAKLMVYKKWKMAVTMGEKEEAREFYATFKKLEARDAKEQNEANGSIEDDPPPTPSIPGEVTTTTSQGPAGPSSSSAVAPAAAAPAGAGAGRGLLDTPSSSGAASLDSDDSLVGAVAL